MQDDLARIAVGLPVASLWSLTVPYLAESRLRVTYVLWSPDDEQPETTDATWKERLAACSPVLAALLLGFTAVALVNFEQGWKAMERAVDSNRVALAVVGLVATVFIGGAVVAWILNRFSPALAASEESSKLQSLDDAGRYIGWLERAVLFAFVIGGAPEAAAVALAAKSFARFPTLSEHHKGFAEYFLIGSLASLTIAVGGAAATRAALGIGPF